MTDRCFYKTFNGILFEIQWDKQFGGTKATCLSCKGEAFVKDAVELDEYCKNHSEALGHGWISIDFWREC